MDAAPAISVTKRELYLIFGALMLGMLLSALDSTIVSTALPTIVADLHGASHLTWVSIGYLLTTTISTPLWGKLGDQYGRKQFFQWAILLFVGGSMLCGISHSMFELVTYRTLQGIGGGGLMVGAQAIIADVVSPMERGRYAGFFGATFGVATVLGPLLGGVIVEYWSWRWIFFVNLPFGILALIVTAFALPASKKRIAHTIDWLGISTLSLAAGGLVLFTSLGGTTYPWFGAVCATLLVVGVVFTVVYVFVERRAKEPILAPHLFANRVFTSASAIGFVVGFAMFGAMVFLPLFFQDVKGISPTDSGLSLLPMMLGLFTCSISTGILVSRGRPYRPFPITGTIVMTIGMALLSTVNEHTNDALMYLYMFVLGSGLGLVMQILTTATQNAVPTGDIGAATAGQNFFRSIGGCFGTAVFGALFSNAFPRQLAAGFGGALPPALSGQSGASLSPADLAHLPASLANVVIHAMAASIQDVYRWAIPFSAVAAILALTLPEVKLRSTVGVVDEVPLSHVEATEALD